MRSIIKCTAAAVLIIAVVGCANLKEVRDFAGESARLSAYTELTTRFRDTYQREQPYLSGEAQAIAIENDRKRQEAYQDLLKIHRTISLYMQTLATLAGDKTFDLSGGIDALATGIKSHPNLIDAKLVDACSNVSRITLSWITSAYQEKAVKEMVTNGDPPLQNLLDGMMSLVRIYKSTNDNERNTVFGVLEADISQVAPEDKLLSILARAHLQQKTREYRIADEKYAEAEKGIRYVKDGHRMIVENIDRLSSAEAIAVIKKIAGDVKAVRDNLQTVRF